MADQTRPPAVIDLVDPTADIRVGPDKAYVYVWDADALGHDWLEDTFDRPTFTKSLPKSVIMVHVHSPLQLRALELDALVPDGGVSIHGSLYENYDRWEETWLWVRATRDGDTIELENGFGHAARRPYAWLVAQDERVSHVRCGAEALGRALERAISRAVQVTDLFERISAADRDAPWAVWSEHPDLAVRERVVHHPHTDHDVLIAYASQGVHTWQLLDRDDLPAAAIEQLMGGELDGNLLRLVAEHPNTPNHILEDLVRSGKRQGRHHISGSSRAAASARLATRAIESADSLDAVFGELRDVLDATPSGHAWEALLETLRAGLACDSQQAAEVWVPYSRERMGHWRASDCVVPLAEVTSWASGSPPGPLWGVSKRLTLDKKCPTPTHDAWLELLKSPFIVGLQNLSLFQPPTATALDVIAALDLPELQELLVTTFGDEGPLLPYDLWQLTRASWLEDLRELTISHVSSTPSSTLTLLESAPSLSWLSLRHLELGFDHGEALARSGALNTMRHMGLCDADTAGVVESLVHHDLPALYHLSLSNAGVTDAHLHALCQSSWLPRLTEIYLTRNPSLTDITPLIAVADQMSEFPMIRLEGCSIPPEQARLLLEVRPKAVVYT